MRPIISLCWPDKALSPNFRSRSHWPRTNALKKARKEAWATAMVAKWNTIRPEGRVALKVTFYPPDNRARDRDNLIASLKPIQDGLADALGIDDSLFDVTYSFGPASKPGRVEVEL